MFDGALFFISCVSTSTSPPSNLDRTEFPSYDSVEKLQISECAGTPDKPIPEMDPLEVQRCVYSTNKFLGSLELADHVAQAHNRSLSKLGCTTNEAQVTTKQQLRKDTGVRNSRAPKSTFPCSVCGFVCRSKHTLQSHFIRKHTDRYEHQCEFCPKKFKIKSDLTAHERCRHKEELEKCNVCGKPCARSGSLSAHHKSADSELKLECRRCMASKKLKQRENREEMDSAGCGSASPKPSELKMHTDDTGTGYAQNSELASHKKTHFSSLPDFPSVRTASILQQFVENFKPENVPSKITGDAEEMLDDTEEGKEKEYENVIEEEVLEFEVHKLA